MRKNIITALLALTCLAAPLALPHPVLAQGDASAPHGDAQGVGRMTIEEYAASRGLQPIEVTQKLIMRGADVTFTTTMKEAAAQLGMTPGELEAELFPR